MKLKLYRHQIFKWVIAPAVLGMILLSVLYLLRGVVLAPYLQRYLQDSIESQLGIRVDIGKISGSYITDLVVTNVATLKPAPNRALAALELRRFKATYNLLSLIKGLNGFLDEATFELEGADLEFDLSRPQALSADLSAAGSPPSFFLPERLPRIHIRNTSVLVKGSGYETAFKGIELEALPTPQTTSAVRLGIAQWRWSHPELGDGHTPVSARIEYSQEKIVVNSLMLADRNMTASGQVGLQRLPQMLSFDGKLALAGGQVAFDGRLDPSDLHVRLTAEHLDPTRIISLFSAPAPPFSGLLTIQADVRLPHGRPADMAADLDLKLTGGRIFGLAADDLVLRAKADDGRLHLETLDLRTGANLLALRDVNAPLATVLEGDWAGLIETTTGRFALDCRDVPSIFLAAGMDLSRAVDSMPAHRVLLDGELRRGDLILSSGSLTADSGYIRLGPSRMALPTKNRPLRDLPLQTALKIDFPDLGLIHRIFAGPQLGGSMQGNVTVAGTLGAPRGSAVVNAEAISFQGMRYGDLTLRVNSDSHTAVVETLAIRREHDRLTGKGIYHFRQRELENVHLEFQIADLAPYAEKFWPQSWLRDHGKPRVGGGAEGNVTLAGPITMPRGALAVNVRQLDFAGNRIGHATLRLHSNGQKITVETLQINQSEDRLELKGSYDFLSRNFENVLLKIAVAQLGAYTRNLFSEKLPLPQSMHGILELSGPLIEPQARTDFRLGHLQLGEFGIPDAHFKARSSGRRIDIDLAEATLPFGRTSLSGRLLRAPDDTDFDLELTTAAFSGLNTSLALDRSARIRFSRDGQVAVEAITVSGPPGRIRLQGLLASHGKFDFHLLISDFSSNGWFESVAGDRLHFAGLNADIHLLGTSQSPFIAVEGDLAQLGDRKLKAFLSGRFNLAYTNAGLSIRQFDWHGDGGRQIAVAGTIPIKLAPTPVPVPGRLAIDAEVNLSDLGVFDFYFPEGSLAGAALQGELHLAGTWDAPAGTISWHCGGLYRLPVLKPSPPGPFDIDGRIRLKGKMVAVESIRINSPGLTLTSNGEWDGMPALADLVRGKVGKPGGKVFIKGNLSAPDLGWLAAEIPNLQRVSGRLEANMTMSGPILDPAINAVLNLTDGEVRPDVDVPSLQSLNLHAVVTPAGAEIQTFTGELGGAPFHMTGAVMRNGGSGTRADLRLRGENLLFYRSEGLKLRADTDLTLKGPISHLKLAGELAITDGRLIKYFNILGALRESASSKTISGFPLFSFREPPLRDMQFDVKLTSKSPFMIRNNLTKGSLRPDLRLSGTGEIPVLSGKVYVDPTRLMLPAGQLVFESGVIRFDANAPDRPALDLMGKARMLGYDITVQVEGPYDDPVVTLSSVPPLSNDELLLLVVTGQRPKASGERTASQQQNINVAVFIGRDLIARWFGAESLEAGESIFDRFELETGRAVTRGGDETIDARFRLSEDVLRDGDTLYITGEKDVFDFYNAGVRIVFRFK